MKTKGTAVIVGAGIFEPRSDPREKAFKKSDDTPPLNEILATLGIEVGSQRCVFLTPRSVLTGTPQQVLPSQWPNHQLIALAVIDDGSENFSRGLEALKNKYPAMGKGPLQ